MDTFILRVIFACVLAGLLTGIENSQTKQTRSRTHVHRGQIYGKYHQHRRKHSRRHKNNQAVVNSIRLSKGGIRGIAERMENNYRTLSSLRANVIMVKTNGQIGTSDVSVGSTNFLPKSGKHVMYVRIDWSKPTVESMVSIGENYKLYRPRLGVVIEGKASSKKMSRFDDGAFAFMSMSKAELQNNYSVSYVGQEDIKDGTPTWHIMMTPKIKTSYKSTDLWIDLSGMPRQTKVSEWNGDTTTVLLTEIEKNIVLDVSIFNLRLPQGTKIIKG